MDKIEAIKKLLADLDMPVAQQSDLCALTILAMGGIKGEDNFSDATNEWIRIHDVIAFVNAGKATLI